ncbi:MAG: MauE/DoxX family redox-associated membrane protein [Acidimicrobiia bacterium]
MTFAYWADGARWALAGVLVLAVVTKMARPHALLQGGIDAQVLGIPARMSRAVSAMLLVLELVLAVLLVALPGPLPGLATAGLFVVYLYALAQVRSRGEQRPCRCFGALSPRPVSGRTLLRQSLFVGVAVVAIFGAVGSPTWAALAGFLLLFAVVLLT